MEELRELLSQLNKRIPEDAVHDRALIRKIMRYLRCCPHCDANLSHTETLTIIHLAGKYPPTH